MLTVNTELIPFLEEMMYEFMDQKLEVCLIPPKEQEWEDRGTMHRVATSVNPEWYQKMCAEFPRPVQPSQPVEKGIKKRTIVKRRDTVKLFERLLKYLKSKSKYAPYLIDEAQRRLELCQDAEGIEPWNNQF
jgi:hypothetical protein